MKRKWEEAILCETDIQCSELWFLHQVKIWKERTKMVQNAGHICYAQKQIAYWSALAKEAKEARSTLQGAILPNPVDPMQPITTS